MAAPIRQKHVWRCLHSVSRSKYKSHFSTSVAKYTKEKLPKFAKCPARVFSGIQPTGIPHLGNYFGAVRNWVQLQEKYDDVIFSIVDLHSITVPQNPTELRSRNLHIKTEVVKEFMKELPLWEENDVGPEKPDLSPQRENILDMTACLLACGIDPEKSILFQQSSVPQHAELSWILSCLCTLPRLSHLPQWKDKSEKLKDPNVGLYTYPILQTADIILYKATDVPVGEDQIHHIELARDLAKSFNRNFSVTFPRPQAKIGNVPKIRSLRNPANKMSKSETNPLSRIDITDSPDEIREKLKKAVTDFTSEVTYDPVTRPGVSNLIDIHSAVTSCLPEEICEDNMLLNTGEYKLKLVDIVIEHLGPIRQEVLRLKGDKSYLLGVLEKGRGRAAVIAESTIQEVKKAVGFS